VAVEDEALKDEGVVYADGVHEQVAVLDDVAVAQDGAYLEVAPDHRDLMGCC
jgi:hypothetical protein